MIPAFIRQELRVILHWLAWLWVPLMSPATAQQIQSGNIAANLDTSIQVATSSPDLRELASTLGQSTSTAIIVDRRLDPSKIATSASEISVENPEEGPLPVLNIGPDYRKALDRISELSNAQWASDGFAVFIAPEEVSMRTAAFSVLQWDSIASDARAKTKGLTELREVSWDALATPTEVLQKIASLWNLDVSKIQLPHDHWPAAYLGRVPVTTALAAVAMGFDRAIEIDLAELTLNESPLPLSCEVRRTYPTRNLGTSEKERIRKANRIGQVSFQQTSDGTSITADAQGHLEAASIFARAKGSSTGTGKPRNPSTSKTNAPKYTLRLVEQGGKALAYLAQTGQIKIRIEPSAVPLLDKRIELEAKDKTLQELMRMVADQAGVIVTEEDETLVFSAP